MVVEDFKVKCEMIRSIAEVKVKFAEFLKENNLRICCSSKYDDKTLVKKTYIEIFYDFYEDGDDILLYSTEFNEEKDKIEYTDLLNV